MVQTRLPGAPIWLGAEDLFYRAHLAGRGRSVTTGVSTTTMPQLPTGPIKSRPQQYLIGMAEPSPFESAADSMPSYAAAEPAPLLVLAERFKRPDSDVKLVDVHGPPEQPRMLVVEMIEDRTEQLKAEFPGLLIEPNADLGY